MSDVPLELCREIFLRLPAKTLFRFRRVCKSWLRMIDDPAFIKAHTDNQDLFSHTLLVRNKTGDPLFSFSLDSLNFTIGPQQIDASYVQQVTHRGMPVLQQDLLYISSCNGLILLSPRQMNRVWTIWNPLTGDCHRLPRPTADSGLKGVYLVGFGLGYDRAEDDYKVVRIDMELSIGNNVCHTLVYSLKSESWTVTEACPRHPRTCRGTFCNGTLYWKGEDGVIALNLGTLRYSQLQLPPDESRFYARLDALEGRLVCSFNDPTKITIDGWVMGEGEAGEWTQLYSLPRPIVYAPDGIIPVAYFKGKEQIVFQYCGGFLWYDIGSASLLRFSVHDFPDINSSRVCPGSLVRLDIRAGAAGRGAFTPGRTLRSKRNTGITDNRLKFCVRDVGDHHCSDICGQLLP